MNFLASAARLSLAVSTLAAEKLAQVAWAEARDGSERLEALDALDSTREAASAELGEVAEVFHNAGDELAQSGLDFLSMLLRREPSLVSVQGLRPEDRQLRARRFEDEHSEDVWSAGLRDLASVLRPGSIGRSARLEARAKLDVFWQVRGARHAHGETRDGRPFALEPALERVQQCRSFEVHALLRFWALEGLGHDYVKGYLESGQKPGGLMRRPALARLDAGDLAAVHAGLGLAVSDFVVGGLHRRAGVARFTAALDRFVDLCERNAANARQQEVAYEALGLVVSVFHGALRQPFESALRPRARLSRLYWHGAGRGAYFSGSQLVPGYGSMRRAVAQVARQAPGALARRDAWAGLGYAFTMVNAEQPDVIVGAFTGLSGEVQSRPGLCLGLGTGVAGALAMQRLLGRRQRADALLEQTSACMPNDLWQALLQDPDRRLREEGSDHELYGALPWGSA